MKNNKKRFAVFILTHGRPENIITVKTLKKCGYTGEVFIIIDNEDKTSEKYKEIYGDKVIIFDKEAIAKTFDEGDNFNDRRSIVYARNACFDIAKEIGVDYFVQFDDDYQGLEYRFNHELEYRAVAIRNMDRVFEIMLDFYKSTPVHSLAMSQGGDFIGGKNSSNAQAPKLLRKCMNSFICSNEKPFRFIGRINEDVNTYTRQASVGTLLFTTVLVSLVQKSTQTNKGGMTDIYLDNGTYIKSFYSVIFSPSSVVISLMGDTHQRLHHRVSWKNAIPQLLAEKHKKS
jgi:hypothetical protein